MYLQVCISLLKCILTIKINCHSDLRLKYCNTKVTIGDPMGTNCAPLLTGLFLHPYTFCKANFLQCVLMNKER